jgi:hypothetical protein
MFQPRDQLRFALEAANKFRLVCQPRQDDLDGYFAPHGRLIGTIDGAKATIA